MPQTQKDWIQLGILGFIATMAIYGQASISSSANTISAMGQRAAARDEQIRSLTVQMQEVKLSQRDLSATMQEILIQLARIDPQKRSSTNGGK